MNVVVVIVTIQIDLVVGLDVLVIRRKFSRRVLAI